MKACPICNLEVPYLTWCYLCEKNGNHDCVCLYCKNEGLTHNKIMNAENKVTNYLIKILNTSDEKRKEIYKDKFIKANEELRKFKLNI